MTTNRPAGRSTVGELGRLWLLALLALGLLALAACGGGSSATDESVARLEVDRPHVLLTGPGQERQLSVRGFNAGGGSVDAKVVWTSSAPDQISVDANGKLRSITALGSAQIVAESAGVRSRPVLVMTAELFPGTLLVRDAEVVRIGAPLPTATPLPGAGLEYDVWLTGVQPPEPGSVVLAAETAPVGGRVVEAAPDGGLLRVRLRLLTMPDLLARYDIDWVIDVTAYDMVYDPSASTAAQRDQALSSREGVLDSTEVRVPDWTFPPGAAEPLCRASAGAKLTTQPSKVKVSGSPKIVYRDSRLQVGLPSGTLKLALVGDFKIETQVGLVAEADLTGEITCELKGGSIPIPIAGPIGLQIPVAVGVTVSGEVKLASLDISLKGENGATFELGVDCAPPRPCAMLDKATPINKFEPHLEVHGTNIDGLKIKLDAFVYFKTGLHIALLNKLAIFEAVEVKAGPKQTADFGSVKRQADDKPYASDYKLLFLLEVAPGKTAKKAIEFLSGTEGDDFSFKLPIEAEISESPNGTWSVDKTTATPNRDAVAFDIKLDPISTEYFLLGYNVERIEVYRKHESEQAFQLVHSQPAASPQASFQWRWEPTLSDAGRNEFAVFAVSKLPVVQLEIGTVQAVQVGCVGGTGSSRPRTQQAGGICKEEWVGTASGEITGIMRFKLRDDFVWEQDLTTVVGPNISALRPKKGASSVEVVLITYQDLGCTVTPEHFDVFPISTLMTVDRNFDPPKYTFGLQVDAELTISCPNSPPLNLPTRVLAIDGGGELTEKGTRMIGGQNSAQGQYSWRFDLKPAEAPAQ